MFYQNWQYTLLVFQFIIGKRTDRSAKRRFHDAMWSSATGLHVSQNKRSKKGGIMEEAKTVKRKGDRNRGETGVNRSVRNQTCQLINTSRCLASHLYSFGLMHCASGKHFDMQLPSKHS